MHTYTHTHIYTPIHNKPKQCLLLPLSDILMSACRSPNNEMNDNNKNKKRRKHMLTNVVTHLHTHRTTENLHKFMCIAVCVCVCMSVRACVREHRHLLINELETKRRSHRLFVCLGGCWDASRRNFAHIVLLAGSCCS